MLLTCFWQNFHLWGLIHGTEAISSTIGFLQVHCQTQPARRTSLKELVASSLPTQYWYIVYIASFKCTLSINNDYVPFGLYYKFRLPYLLHEECKGLHIFNNWISFCMPCVFSRVPLFFFGIKYSCIFIQQLRLEFQTESDLLEINLFSTGTCEAESIIRGEIRICKYWAGSSCFQRTGTVFLLSLVDRHVTCDI